MLATKWMATDSLSYFKFIQSLIACNFVLNEIDNTEENRLMALMLYYDFYQASTDTMTLEKAIKDIGKNKSLVAEMAEFIDVKIDQVGFEEIPCADLGFAFPLKIHARYTRDQILVALGITTFDKKSSNREGTALNKELNTEALFINLLKSEEDFSPTTMYDDYAINEDLFHWQSQNQTTPHSDKGKAYIQQNELKRNILLFIRESNKDAHGFTQGYVFVGPAHFVEYKGAKPMSITWQLEEPIPEYIWTASAKMAVG